MTTLMDAMRGYLSEHAKDKARRALATARDEELVDEHHVMDYRLVPAETVKAAADALDEAAARERELYGQLAMWMREVPEEHWPGDVRRIEADARRMAAEMGGRS